MNNSVYLGVIVFLVWFAFCNYWYTCKTKGICSEEVLPASAQLSIEEQKEPVRIPEIDTASLPPDSVEVKRESIAKSISISESELLFKKNSLELANSDYATNFFDKISTEIGNESISVEITGHTCDLGAPQHNQQLGLKRARKVYNHLLDKGLNIEKIDILSLGESNPISDNAKEENRRRNRRVELIIKSIEP